MEKKVVVSVGKDTEIKVTVSDDNGNVLAVACGGYCGGMAASDVSDWPNVALIECRNKEPGIEAVKSVTVEVLLRGRPFASAYVDCEYQKEIFREAGFKKDEDDSSFFIFAPILKQ